MIFGDLTDLDARFHPLFTKLYAAAAMEPLTGPELVSVMRHVDAGPLRFIPAMIMSATTKTRLLDEALRAGAHQVLVLPIVASTLYRRLDWLINDDCPYELRGGHYIVAGLEERLAMRFERPDQAPIQLPESSPLGGRAGRNRALCLKNARCGKLALSLDTGRAFCP